MHCPARAQSSHFTRATKVVVSWGQGVIENAISFEPPPEHTPQAIVINEFFFDLDRDLT